MKACIALRTNYTVTWAAFAFLVVGAALLDMPASVAAFTVGCTALVVSGICITVGIVLSAGIVIWLICNDPTQVGR